MVDKEETGEIEFTREDNQEDVELEVEEEALGDKLKSLREKLKTCEAEKATHLEELQRAKAEFLNTRKRLEDQALVEKERIVDKHILELLPLCDSFDMAMMNEELWQSIDASWRSGVEGIHNQLMSILKSYSVESFAPIGESFDPNLHEAMGTTDSKEYDSDTVVQVLQKGYMRNGTVIREAKVIVSN